MKRHAPVSHGEIRYLYVRIRARATLAASPGLAGSAATGSIEKVCEFALEVEVGGIREFAARDNDDIDAGIGLQMTEQFACKSLGPVSNNRPTNLACRRDTETGMVTIVALDEDRHESPTETNTGLVGSLEIRTASDVFCRPESGHDALSRRRVGTACVELPLVGDGQPLSPLRATALQDLLSVFGRHPDQEPMGPLAAPVVWLKRTLTLRHR